MINPLFWRDKRVFITGHTGFKGSWLSLWLQELGAVVKGYALDAPSEPSMFEVAGIEDGMESHIADVRDLHTLTESIRAFQPEVVLHLAAQALVRQSYKLPVETYSTNIMGTVHLLDACREAKSVKAVVIVTSDKCYENKEWVWGYRESDPMGGYDPYSSSKGCAELVTASYLQSYFNPALHGDHGVGLASVRAGNVVGGGDWALDRLVPDILHGFQKGKPVEIRNPHAIRPWQHVLEPLSGYITLAEALCDSGAEYAGSWNFGPEDKDAKPVQYIVERLAANWGKEAEWSVSEGEHPHEAHYLKLDCSKARMQLNWQPVMDLDTTLEKIAAWQKAWLNGENMRAHTLAEIRQYMELRTTSG